MRINFYNSTGKKISFLNDSGETLNFAESPFLTADELMQYYQRFSPEITAYQIDADYEATQHKKQQYAAVNAQYAAEIANIREAIRCVLDKGGDAMTLRGKLAAKQTEYKTALLGVM